MSLFLDNYPLHMIKFVHGRPEPGSPFEQWHATEIRKNFDNEGKLQGPIAYFDHYTNVMKIRVLLLGHKPKHLETVLRSFVQREGGNLTSSQIEGRQRYQFLLQQYIHIAPENDDLLLEYYNAFNECFFFGLLKSLCKVQFFSPESMPELDGCCCCDSPEIPNNFMCLIKIRNKANENRNLSNETRLRDYLSTLLHEMLHAFFDVYTYRFDAQSMRIQYPGLGISGHACPWQSSALSLEDATATLYGGRLDLGRMEGVDTEFSESGQSPLQEDLDYWRLQWRH